MMHKMGSRNLLAKGLVVLIFLALVSSAHAMWPFNQRKSVSGVVSRTDVNFLVLLPEKGNNSNVLQIILPAGSSLPVGVHNGSRVRVTIQPSPVDNYWELVQVEEIFVAPNNSYKPNP